ncbi:MAG: DUF711 family protein [Anaerolineae bacterium]|nr:DUF711 family protein [Anaerolineae bacterium]
MDIRAVTLFSEHYVNPAAHAPFIQAAATAFHVPVQSLRLATTPFPDWLEAGDLGAVTQLVKGWQTAGITYLSLGPVQIQHDAHNIHLLHEIIAMNDAVFGSVEVADQNGRIAFGRIQATARLIRKLSTTHANGFGNLYMTAIANCPPHTPFFPVAYHSGGPTAFAIAVESADIARSAFRATTTLAEARENLVTYIEQEAGKLADTAARLSAEYNLPFLGIDFCLAPFPTNEKSIGGALEDLGAAFVGAPGSLFAAAFITDAIQRASYPHCGFNGLMLPVLEDNVVALRAAEGQLSIADLLSYSAVCGVGLDTVPLPGDVDETVLAGILLDVAALAVRLNKPLTARLMPMPGLAAGDPLTFDFPYFADSRVMKVHAHGIRGLMQTSAELKLNPYASRLAAKPHSD